MHKMVTWKIYDYMYHLSTYATSLVLSPVNLIIVTSTETETSQASCFAFLVIDVNKIYLVLRGVTSHKVSEPYSDLLPFLSQYDRHFGVTDCRNWSAGKRYSCVVPSSPSVS
jgi:hypothetical protein